MCFELSSAHAGQYARDTPRSPMNSATMKMFLNSASWRWRIVGSCGLPRIYRTRIGNSHAEGCSAIRSVHRKTVGNFQVETQLWSGGSPKKQAPLVSNYCRSPKLVVLQILHNPHRAKTLRTQIWITKHSQFSVFLREEGYKLINDDWVDLDFRVNSPACEKWTHLSI